MFLNTKKIILNFCGMRGILISYIDHLKNKDMSDNPDSYFKNVQVVNFDIIHHKCRGDELKGTYKDYRTIEKNIWLITQKRKLKLFCRLPFVTKGTIYGSNLTFLQLSILKKILINCFLS